MSNLENKLYSILQEKCQKIVPDNIRKDIEIFNVTGTLEEGVDTSDANAIAADISSGKTAYVNGQKVIGTATILNGQEKTITPTTQEQIITPDSNYNALNQVTISAVTNNIDSNIIPENIKAGVTILGVTGTYTGEAINEEVEGG